jgi:hypothetical protein
MRRIPIAVLLLLFALVCVGAIVRSAEIDIDQGGRIYTDENQVNLSGRVFPDYGWWADYYDSQYKRGTTHNVTIYRYSIELEPDLNVSVLNGGSPVLRGASSGSWDSHLLQLDVVKEGGRYFMFYCASNASANGTRQIGLATSTDGLSWTRYGTGPVLKAGVDTYDYYGLSDPVVMVENGTWHMWYGGDRNGTSPDVNLCYATSSDGYSWSKHSSNPLMTSDGNASAWNGTAIMPQSVLRDGNQYRLYYSAVGTSNVTFLAIMTSSDGVNWTDYRYNPIYKGGWGWENREARYGPVEHCNGSYRMWIYGGGDSGWRIGYMTSYTGYNWSSNSTARVVPRAGTSYSKHVMEPAVVYENGGYTMFARGVNDTGVAVVNAFRLTPERLNGTYTSNFKDMGDGAVVYGFYWYRSSSTGTRVRVEARYGNSTGSMSGWTNIPRSIYGMDVTARYVQYRVLFTAERDWFSPPSFYEIECYYLIPIKRLAYRLDNGPDVNMTLDENRTWRLSLNLPEGAHQVMLWVEDASNGTSTVNCWIYVDQTAPTGEILIEWGMNTTAKTTVEVLLKANDTSLPIMAYLSNRPDLQGAVGIEMGLTGTGEWAFGNSTVGKVKLYAKFMDVHGRWSPLYNDTIIIDRAPPEGSIEIENGSTHTNSRDVTLSIDWYDESGVFLMWLSNTPDLSGADSMRVAREVPWRLGAGEGVKTVYLRLMDELGWTSNLSATIILDQTPPVASIAIDGGAEYCSDLRVELTIEMDDLAPMEVVFTNPADEWPDDWESFPSGWSAPWTMAEGEDGPRTVLMMVRDAAGNTQVVYDDIVLDRAGPVGYFTINGGADLTASQDVTLDIVATDMVSGLDAMVLSNTISFPDSGWRDFASRVGWTLSIVDGEKRVYVMLRDNAGATSILQATIVLDTMPPEGTVTVGDGSGYCLDPHVTLSLDMADENGVSEMCAFIGTGPGGEEAWVPYASTMEWTLPRKEGEHVLEVWVRDMAGNVLTVETTVVLDMTDPLVSIDIAGGAEYTMEGLVEAAWSASDGNGLAAVRFAYEPNFTGVDWTNPFSRGAPEHSGVEAMVVAAEGERPFYVQVVDLAGRVATASDTVWYVRDRPEGTIQLGNGSRWTGTEVVLVTAQWTGGSEATRFRVALSRDGLDGAEWVAIDQVTSVQLPRRSGFHQVHAQLHGPFDILSEPFVESVTLDLTQPIVHLVKPHRRTTTGASTDLLVGITEDLDSDPVVRWRVNGGGWHTYTGETSVDLGMGSNLIEVQCTDGAGNSGQATWTIRRDEPEGTGVAIVAGAVVAVALVALLALYVLRYRNRGDGVAGEDEG